MLVPKYTCNGLISGVHLSVSGKQLYWSKVKIHSSRIHLQCEKVKRLPKDWSHKFLVSLVQVVHLHAGGTHRL